MLEKKKIFFLFIVFFSFLNVGLRSYHDVMIRFVGLLFFFSLYLMFVFFAFLIFFYFFTSNKPTLFVTYLRVMNLFDVVLFFYFYDFSFYFNFFFSIFYFLFYFIAKNIHFYLLHFNFAASRLCIIKMSCILCFFFFFFVFHN